MGLCDFCSDALKATGFTGCTFEGTEISVTSHFVCFGLTRANGDTEIKSRVSTHFIFDRKLYSRLVTDRSVTKAYENTTLIYHRSHILKSEVVVKIKPKIFRPERDSNP